MKKLFVFFILTAFILIFSTCNLQFPRGVEIKGSRSLRLSADVDLGKYLNEHLEEMMEGDGVFLIPTDQDYITFIFHIVDDEPIDLEDVLDDPMKFPGLVAGIIGMGSGTWYEDITFNAGNFVIPKIDFGNDNAFGGFSLASGVSSAKVYISSESDILDSLSISIGGNPVSPENKGIPSSLVDLGAQIDPIYNIDSPYTGNNLPAGGTVIQNFSLNNNEADQQISFQAIIPAGTTIKKEWIDAPIVLFIEFSVCLPVKLIAKNGAVLEFPDDMFSEDDDLFGRDSLTDEGMGEFIKSLSFGLKLSERFIEGDAWLIMYSGDSNNPDIEIKNELIDTILAFAISEIHMDKINNDVYPFTPKLKIEFEEGAILEFPLNLKITEVAFSASIGYSTSFTGD